MKSRRPMAWFVAIWLALAISPLAAAGPAPAPEPAAAAGPATPEAAEAAPEPAPAPGPATPKAAAEPAPAPTPAAVAARPTFAQIFRTANQAYLDGDYARAAAGYRKLLEAGLVHPDLYYNLANAYYRAGRLGLAVLFYEKTLALNPSDAAAASNLTIARKALIDRVVMPESGVVGEPLWHGFIRSLNLTWLTWSFLGLWILVFGLLIVRRLVRGPLRRLVFWINVPLLSVVLVLGTLLFARIYVQERVHHGVVISAAAALREGPERSAKELMQLHAGLKVRVLNHVGDHVRVRLANGVEGFLLDRQLGQI